MPPDAGAWRLGVTIVPCTCKYCSPRWPSSAPPAFRGTGEWSVRCTRASAASSCSIRFSCSSCQCASSARTDAKPAAIALSRSTPAPALTNFIGFVTPWGPSEDEAESGFSFAQLFAPYRWLSPLSKVMRTSASSVTSETVPGPLLSCITRSPGANAGRSAGGSAALGAAGCSPMVRRPARLPFILTTSPAALDTCLPALPKALCSVNPANCVTSVSVAWRQSLRLNVEMRSSSFSARRMRMTARMAARRVILISTRFRWACAFGKERAVAISEDREMEAVSTNLRQAAN